MRNALLRRISHFPHDRVANVGLEAAGSHDLHAMSCTTPPSTTPAVRQWKWNSSGLVTGSLSSAPRQDLLQETSRVRRAVSVHRFVRPLPLSAGGWHTYTFSALGDGVTSLVEDALQRTHRRTERK